MRLINPTVVSAFVLKTRTGRNLFFLDVRLPMCVCTSGYYSGGKGLDNDRYRIATPSQHNDFKNIYTYKTFL